MSMSGALSPQHRRARRSETGRGRKSRAIVAPHGCTPAQAAIDNGLHTGAAF
ncbi:hypothetical protein pneo_cds_839 [Pandoravirus neocaledonia]|uniref:Uncharacterized protein n=1 Tax=Pandoravirus neocaledonia TaxID=2107708 RepID=A0A2U7UDD6_9VIRU|nr:hypothetical protein pneo_cds_839 [Pandoravirus neocaledonia]AVK76446.1 hypothetical protein pneo_cds_839 [Pandoravirus neocaledonia]